MAAALHSAPGIRFALDTPGAVPVTPTEAYLKGWFVPEEFVSQNQACELWVTVGNQHVQAFTGLPRLDVARQYRNNPAFKYSGFIARFVRPAVASLATLSARTPAGEAVLADEIPVPPAEPLPSSAEKPLNGPVISVLIVIPPGAYPYLVTCAIQSVRRQAYPHARLFLIGQSSPMFEAERIEWLESDEQLTGDFVLFLDYRDELAPGALAEISAAASDADLIYTDEQQIDFYGHPLTPFAKPDFDSEALLSWNYMGNGVAIRRSSFSSPFPNSWELLQRITRQIDPARIRHIQKPLYYVRKGDEVTIPLPREEAPLLPSAEPGLFPGSIRLRHPLPEETSIAVVIRPDDGIFQRAVLAQAADSRIRICTKNGEELDADVRIYINGPLDTLNHCFFEELASQALRADCDIATGLALDRRGRILHSGLRQGVDRFKGFQFGDTTLPRELLVVRSVDAVSKLFYAVKRNIDPEEVAAQDGRVLVTPYAIATFDMMIEDDMPDQPQQASLESKLNELAGERNYLRRELDAAREALARIEASRCQDLKARVAELEAALEAQRRAHLDLQGSVSWKITSPLRACTRLIRGK